MSSNLMQMQHRRHPASYTDASVTTSMKIRQTDRWTDKTQRFLAAMAVGEIRASPNLAWW